MDINLQNAYKICADICVSHYENFPVASRLIPNELRPHVYAIYAFARTADDFADEPGLAGEERLARLEEWEERLKEFPLLSLRAKRSNLKGADAREIATAPLAPRNDGAIPTQDIFMALEHTIRKFNLPINLFTDLLQAFKMDVTKTRYRNWNEVMFYCLHSANPVGRLILALFGERGEKKEEMSDAICTALQLTNFWQDLALDFKRGRLYLPQEDMAKFGLKETDIAAGLVTPAYGEVMKLAADRTEELFDLGRPLVREVNNSQLGRELRLVWLGGMRILERLRDINFDVFRHRPALTLKDKIIIGARALKC